MKTEIQMFLKCLILFIIILTFVDFCLGRLLETVYYSQRKGQFAQTTYSIDSTTQDILIFGSSRAVRHYSPKLMEEALAMSCYNVGRDAQMIPYYVAMQEAIFKRYKPKMVILDINSWELSPGEGKYEKLSILLPYASRHPELVPYLEKSSMWERLKLLSKTYPYNSSLFILGYNTIFSGRVPADENGYAPLSGEMTDLMLEDHLRRMALSGNSEDNQAIDVQALDYYRQFLSATERYDIKTYVVISPKILREAVTYRTQKLIDIASQFRNVTFINFSSNPAYNMKYQKFSDVFHLNKTGAEEFTKDLVKLIR